MERWLGLGEIPEAWGPSVVTIGVFDGVHRGHQRIVARAAGAARELGLPLVVVTFDPHPSEVIRPGSHPAVLHPAPLAQLLGELGADAVCVLQFTLSSRPEPGGVRPEVLADRLHARRSWWARTSASPSAPRATSPRWRNWGRSTTRRRGHPAAGAGRGHDVVQRDQGPGRRRDVVATRAASAGPHRVEGVVVRGEQSGRALGVPTANLETAAHTAIPADGVYAGWLASLDAVGQEAERWSAAISVGANPTFDGQQRVVEAHALDRDDLDLYGVHVAVDFAARLRGMVRFDSADALVAQMRADIAAARALAAGAGG